MANGRSAYQLWLDEGYEGTILDFFRWLRGPQGPEGDRGEMGFEGPPDPPGPSGGRGAPGVTDVFTDSDNGLVPTPGPPTGSYLKDDGTWDDPSGGTGHGTGTVGQHGDVDLTDIQIGEGLVWSGTTLEPGAVGGGSSAPKSATLTRDGNGAVETVTVQGEATWTLSRNPDESVASLTNGTYNVAVDRDGNGVVTGITVT